MTERDSRRAFLSIAGAGALLAACRNGDRSSSEPTAQAATSSRATTTDNDESGKEKSGKEGENVGAVEDLMREHGVIRRVLVVYREAATRLRARSPAIPPDALQNAARLMRTFGEDYHERQLEELHIFPALTRSGELADMVRALTAQHDRGRAITEYVLSHTQKAIAPDAADPLSRTLEAFARMYEEHAAFEDTIVFPAWKKTLSPQELDAMGERFESIEHKTFGKDGFDDAVGKIGAIETRLGIALGDLTAPPPPQS